MKGVTFAKAGAEPEVVDNIEKPSPAPDQVLVKSLWTAINPVDGFMNILGNSVLPWDLVLGWPNVLGVDASGVVVEAGSEAQSKYGLKPGSYVCGCTRLGSPGYSTCQEYFLMDAPYTMHKPKNVDLKEAATLGVACETAALGIFGGLHIDLPDPKNLPAQKDEWVVVMGGAASVGKCAVQLAIAAGYKVIASCSPKSAGAVESLGAKTFDYKKPINEQVQAVLDATGTNVSRVFDATSADDPELAKELFKKSTAKAKFFTTTNDWSAKGDFEGGKTWNIMLGRIGRKDPEAQPANDLLKKYIPFLTDLVEEGKLKPSEYTVVGDGGFEDAAKAFKLQSSGGGGSKKVIVKIQDE